MQTISLGQAFAHCFSTGSYVGWLVASLIILAFAIWVSFAKITNATARLAVIFLAFVFFLFALLMRPTEISANTTQDEAAKGIFIGY